MGQGQCGGGLLDSAKETLVLAIRVGKSTLLDSPDTIEKILKDTKVRKAIEAAATAQAKVLVEKQRKGQKVTLEDVSKGAKATGKAALGPLKTTGLRELRESATGSREYEDLKKGLKQLECAWKQSPVGVWVDKHKGLLYIVGAGLAVSGAIAMYKFRAGDFIAGPATSLAKGLVKFKVLGNVEIAAKEIKFVPSKRVVGTKVMVTAKWERVKVKFEAGITFQETSVTQGNSRGEVSLKLATGLTLKGHGGYEWKAPKPGDPPQNPHRYDLGVGISYENTFGISRLTVQALVFGQQTATTTKYGGKADLKLRVADPGIGHIDLTAGFDASRTSTLPTALQAQPQTGSEVKGTIGAAWHW